MSEVQLLDLMQEEEAVTETALAGDDVLSIPPPASPPRISLPTPPPPLSPSLATSLSLARSLAHSLALIALFLPELTLSLPELNRNSILN